METKEYYKLKFSWLKQCIYCGELATTHDHVMPISKAAYFDLSNGSVRHALFQGLNVVPACLECNLLAEARSFISIREKRKFIQKKLKRRYKSYLNSPEWSGEEIEELGFFLKNEVLKSINIRNSLFLRLMWPKRSYKI